ncbi:Sec-independent protein translocase protein TatB [Stenotrophomonas lacuserhaii]|uniref:Sec-independent protein translocase protein TatB n=1 Tax=Stenotrophomonas lacuserhaii TaxID=2760084 RepID=UPI0032EC16DC
MFDIGFSELLVVAIVALVVLGPERLPKAARFAGLWVRRARNQWDSVKQELERELQAEDIKRQMQDVRQSMQDTESELRASGEAARRQMQDVDDQGRVIADEVRGTPRATASMGEVRPTPETIALDQPSSAPAVLPDSRPAPATAEPLADAPAPANAKENTP